MVRRRLVLLVSVMGCVTAMAATGLAPAAGFRIVARYKVSVTGGRPSDTARLTIVSTKRWYLVANTRWTCETSGYLRDPDAAPNGVDHRPLPLSLAGKVTRRGVLALDRRGHRTLAHGSSSYRTYARLKIQAGGKRVKGVVDLAIDAVYPAFTDEYGTYHRAGSKKCSVQAPDGRVSGRRIRTPSRGGQ